MKETGRFITLEGGEGTGKSTQVKRLAKALEAKKIKVVITREPGGAPGAEEIRKLMVEGEPGRWNPITETLLAYAARADHVARTIGPALTAGRWVISDRFSDSTYAYQGVGRGVERETIRRIDSAVLDDFAPDLILVSAGFDAHARDPLAHQGLEAEDFAWATRAIVSVARRRCGGKLVSTLEGGYDLRGLADSATAHLRALQGE